jgi:hypothetical protein
MMHGMIKERIQKAANDVSLEQYMKQATDIQAGKLEV